MQIRYKKGFRSLNSSYGFFFDCQCFLEDLSIFLLQIFSFLTISLLSSKELVAADRAWLSDTLIALASFPTDRAYVRPNFQSSVSHQFLFSFPSEVEAGWGQGALKTPKPVLQQGHVLLQPQLMDRSKRVCTSAFCFCWDGVPLHSAHEIRVRPLGKIAEDFTCAVELCWFLYGSLLQKVNQLEIHLTHIPPKDLK